MRLFIALTLPPSLKTELAALQQALRAARAEVAWTKPENLHLTLRFLGETPAERVAALAQACRATAQSCPSFTLTLDGTGFFPNARRPRVVWAGLSGELAALFNLHQALETHLTEHGFPSDGKAFQPHLTLGRCKSSQQAEQLAARAAAYQLPALAFRVTELTLLQSRLHPAGSSYTLLLSAGLAA